MATIAAASLAITASLVSLFVLFNSYMSGYVLWGRTTAKSIIKMRQKYDAAIAAGNLKRAAYIAETAGTRILVLRYDDTHDENRMERELLMLTNTKIGAKLDPGELERRRAALTAKLEAVKEKNAVYMRVYKDLADQGIFDTTELEGLADDLR